MSKLSKTLISLGLLLLLSAPLVAIFVLSKAEVKQYEPQPVPPLIEKAYGEIFPVEHMDISETISVTGIFVSTEKFFMELPNLKNPYGMRMLVEPEDEITKDQLIGYSEDLKTEIRATSSGVVLGISLGPASYITLESVEKVALECHIDAITLEVLKRENLQLSTQNGEEVKILSISKTQDKEGTTSAVLSVPGGVYGQAVKDLQLQTGRVFNQALAVDARCLFHLNGDKKKWYVRTVDANGSFLEDAEVKVSYSSGEYAAISGVPEGTLCDSGYQRIAEEVDRTEKVDG